MPHAKLPSRWNAYGSSETKCIKVSKEEVEDVEVQLQFKHLIRASVLLIKEEDLYTKTHRFI
jgi:hypothetical protein